MCCEGQWGRNARANDTSLVGSGGLLRDRPLPRNVDTQSQACSSLPAPFAFQFLMGDDQHKVSLEAIVGQTVCVEAVSLILFKITKEAMASLLVLIGIVGSVSRSIETLLCPAARP